MQLSVMKEVAPHAAVHHAGQRETQSQSRSRPGPRASGTCTLQFVRASFDRQRLLLLRGMPSADASHDRRNWRNRRMQGRPAETCRSALETRGEVVSADEMRLELRLPGAGADETVPTFVILTTCLRELAVPSAGRQIR